MLFGATFACPRCMLRFARRERCPSCGGPVVSLAEREGRAAVRGRRRGGAAAFLAPFAPSRPLLPLAIGVLMMAPALATPFLGPSWLLQSWFVDDRTGAVPHFGIEHHGLSWRGIQILAIGGLGLLLLAYTVATSLARRAAKPPPEKPLRVHVEEAEGVAKITGAARVATVEMESPLGGEPCLVVGLSGDVDGEQVSDADGGDFDVVTDDGDVFMVSLEHARLEPVGGEPAIELTVAEAIELEPFLADRVGQRIRERCTLSETIVAAGDTVSITGRLSGPAVALPAYRGGQRGRVITGDADRPLVIRIMRRAASA